MLIPLTAYQVILLWPRRRWKDIKGRPHLQKYIIPSHLSHFPFLCIPHSPFPPRPASPNTLIYIKLTAAVVMRGHWRVSRLALIDASWSCDLNSVPGWAGFDCRVFFLWLTAMFACVSSSSSMVRPFLLCFDSFSHCSTTAWTPFNSITTAAKCRRALRGMCFLHGILLSYWQGLSK